MSTAGVDQAPPGNEDDELIRRIAAAVVDELDRRQRDLDETLDSIHARLASVIRDFVRLENRLGAGPSRVRLAQPPGIPELPPRPWRERAEKSRPSPSPPTRRRSK